MSLDIVSGTKIALFYRSKKLFLGSPEYSYQWDCGKLDDFPSTHVIVHTTNATATICNGDMVRIKTIYPNIEKHEYLYSGPSGWTWYDMFNEDVKQVWKIHKKDKSTKEVQSGDVITIESCWYQENFLSCDKNGYLIVDEVADEWEIEFPRFTKEDPNHKPRVDLAKHQAGKAFFNNALKKFSGRQSNRSEKTSKLMEDLKKKIEEIEELKSKLKDELRRKKDLNEKVNSLRELNDEKVTRLVEVGEELRNVESKFKDTISELESYKSQVQTQDGIINNLKTRIKKLEEDYERSKVEQTKGLEEELKLFKEKENKRFEAETNELKTLNQDLKSKLESSQASEKKHKDDLTKANIQVESLNIVSKSQTTELLTLRKQVDQLTRERDESENDVKKHQSEIKKLTEEINKLKQTIPKKDIPNWKETLEKIKSNDKNLAEVVFMNVGITDQHVTELCVAMVKNTNVSKIDLSDNVLIHGECAKNVADLLISSQNLLELVFNGCPIRPEYLKEIKDGVKKNQSLVQCSLGTNETDQDIQEIEMIMERNFQILSQ